MLRALNKHHMQLERSGGEVTVTTNSGIVLTVVVNDDSLSSSLVEFPDFFVYHCIFLINSQNT